MKLHPVLLALTAILGLQSSASAANILVNGGLETPACSVAVCAFVIPTGWGGGGNIDIVSNGLWQPQEGNQSVDLNAGSNGDLSQTFNTTPGALYQVSFYLSGNPFNGPAVKSLDVSVGAVTNSYTFDITGRSGSDMGWTQQTFQFTAPGATATLLFSSTSNPSTNAGPAIDNVSVELLRDPVSGVPEPSSVLLTLSGMAATLIARRRLR